MIRILAIGKKHQPWVEPGINRYQVRLQKPWNISWQLVPHSNYDNDRARDEESTRLIGYIKDSDYVILLDEVGTNLSSPKLSTKLQAAMSAGQNLTLVIGGAYGVNQSLRQRSDLVWSLSKLVFPHQLVRLIVAEQLYRAQEISKNSAYHHL